jgi:hypothetical protein
MATRATRRFTLSEAGRRLLRLGNARIDLRQSRLLSLVNGRRDTQELADELGETQPWVDEQLEAFATTGLIEEARTSQSRRGAASGGESFTSFFESALPTDGFEATEMLTRVAHEAPEPQAPGAEVEVAGQRQSLSWFERYASARERMMAFLQQQGVLDSGGRHLLRDLERAGASEKLLSLFPLYRDYVQTRRFKGAEEHVLVVENLLRAPGGI